MEGVSSRHEDELGGQLLPFQNTKILGVTVEVEREAAGWAPVQHTAWMLVNLLARLDGVVGRIGFACPSGVPLAGRVVPLARDEREFARAVLVGARAIGVVEVMPDERLEVTLTVGPGCSVGSGWRVHGEGWWGGISTAAIVGGGVSALPFGPYVAASLAAAEIFKMARMLPGSFDPTTSCFYSTWLHRMSTAPEQVGPDRLEALSLDLALAGVGAVGSAWVHAMWACPGAAGQATLADRDARGVDNTNLNRYPLFGRASVGRAKAREAAEIAAAADLVWLPYDGPLESLGPKAGARVISAVDSNRSRSAIQSLYPGRILSGSTQDLRAEILRCGPPGVGACLRCYNPPEALPSDEQIRERLLQSDERERLRYFAEARVTTEEGELWLRRGRCGEAGERLLSVLRQRDTEPMRFAVSFVSVLAGTMLAAETVKDSLAPGGPLSNSLPRAVVQLWRPATGRNGAGTYRRDAKCPMCAPGTEATRIWLDRFERAWPSRP